VADAWERRHFAGRGEGQRPDPISASGKAPGKVSKSKIRAEGPSYRGACAIE